MTAISVANTAKGTYAHSLAADTIDVVTIHADIAKAEVFSDGTEAIYFTVDGTDPVVADDDTFELPSGVAAARKVTIKSSVISGTPGTTVIKLISAGTPKYSITIVDVDA